jgi:hypothetical protein
MYIYMHIYIYINIYIHIYGCIQLDIYGCIQLDIYGHLSITLGLSLSMSLFHICSIFAKVAYEDIFANTMHLLFTPYTYLLLMPYWLGFVFYVGHVDRIDDMNPFSML